MSPPQNEMFLKDFNVRNDELVTPHVLIFTHYWVTMELFCCVMQFAIHLICSCTSGDFFLPGLKAV